MASCILFQNADQTLTLLDVPQSIEQAQCFQKSDIIRLISSQAIKQPYDSVEPKSAKALRNVEAASVRSLILTRFIALALEEARMSFKGPWCLTRVTQENAVPKSQMLKQQPQGASEDPPIRETAPASNSAHYGDDDPCGSYLHNVECLIPDILHHNMEPVVKQIQVGSGPRLAYVPPQSSFLQGNIEITHTIFNLTAPKFNLVILDPPWPNRSARRKQSYSISNNTSEILALLSSIPLTSHLAEDALVGIWVTNKPTIHDLVFGRNGLFDSWGLELTEEWVWLKVTTSGEPICALDSTWRKPYEILLVGQKRSPRTANAEFKRRVTIGVPDLHSRKPNLKALFEPMLPSKYEALEIFARNMTAGWWAWGNEVLKFQSEEHWLDSNET